MRIISSRVSFILWRLCSVVHYTGFPQLRLCAHAQTQMLMILRNSTLGYCKYQRSGRLHHMFINLFRI